MGPRTCQRMLRPYLARPTAAVQKAIFEGGHGGDGRTGRLVAAGGGAVFEFPLGRARRDDVGQGWDVGDGAGGGAGGAGGEGEGGEEVVVAVVLGHVEGEFATGAVEGASALDLAPELGGLGGEGGVALGRGREEFGAQAGAFGGGGGGGGAGAGDALVPHLEAAGGNVGEQGVGEVGLAGRGEGEAL